MIDLDTIKAENAQRRTEWKRESDLPMPKTWNVIDALVAEVERLQSEIAWLRDPTYKPVPHKGD